MTTRLFWENQYLKQFTARIVKSYTLNKKPALVLDKTAFYATSGGQLNDTGIISTPSGGKVKVVDVIEDKDTIIHILEKPDPSLKEGDEINGEIDWERRVDHMQQHHGQHILSKAFIDVASASTLSFHMGSDVSYIDLDKRDELTDEVNDQVMKVANQVIFDNLSVSTAFHTMEEAKKLPLRKLDSGLQEPIRIVTVGGFDMQACCGTHPSSTGQVQCISIINQEKIKKTTRLYFVCGMRATSRLASLSLSLKRMALKVMKPSLDYLAVEKSFEILQDDNNKLRKIQADLEKEAQKTTVEAILNPGYPNVQVLSDSKTKLFVVELEGKDMNFIRAVGKDIVTEHPDIIIATLTPLPIDAKEKTSVGFYITQSANLESDLRPKLKDIFADVPGKGGGEKHLVQGTFMGDISKVKASIDKHLKF